MEHRGIRYEIRARGYPQKWEWAVYPNGASQRLHWSGEVVGGRHLAIDAAQRFIDEWLEKRAHRGTP
jgi:hypothetical protein